jgi:hypothetical protein
MMITIIKYNNDNNNNYGNNNTFPAQRLGVYLDHGEVVNFENDRSEFADSMSGPAKSVCEDMWTVLPI